MAVAAHISTALSGSSLIRKMFTEGESLKARFGAGNVYDFTLGNPDVPPPEEFTKALQQILSRHSPGGHSYMASGGLIETRQRVANTLKCLYRVDAGPEQVTMTAGAGSALSLSMAVLLNPDERILVNAPSFVAYGNYAAVHQGKLDVVPGLEDFSLNLEGIEKKLGPDTAAVIINSPNNPSGAIYSEDSLKELALLLEQKSREFNRRIYILSDEPYREIVYDPDPVPSPYALYPHTILCYSWSKSLSIPGERIGYAAVHPEAENADLITQGLCMMTQNMGITNAPALMQRAVARLSDVQGNIESYRLRRDLLAEGLSRAGYEFHLPRGAFYLFPKVPGGDDAAFCEALKNEERILTVPGRGFYQPGFFRISYCVSEEKLKNALAGFARVRENFAG